MCSIPSTSTPPKAETKDIAAPTYADAQVTKAGADQKQKQKNLAGRDIKTTARGLSSNADTQKKELLGD